MSKEEVSRFNPGPVSRLPAVSEFRSISIQGQTLTLEWESHTSETVTTLDMPLAEGEKLLRNLADAYREGRFPTKPKGDKP